MIKHHYNLTPPSFYAYQALRYYKETSDENWTLQLFIPLRVNYNFIFDENLIVLRSRDITFTQTISVLSCVRSRLKKKQNRF